LLFPSQDDDPVSQMYFDGEPLNEKDRWLQSALPGTTEVLIAKLLPWPLDLEADLQLVIFDIVTLRR
jgi:protocatechuate 3,4-dioxygenase, beta subunit